MPKVTQATTENIVFDNKRFCIDPEYGQIPLVGGREVGLYTRALTGNLNKTMDGEFSARSEEDWKISLCRALDHDEVLGPYCPTDMGVGECRLLMGTKILIQVGPGGEISFDSALSAQERQLVQGKLKARVYMDMSGGVRVKVNWNHLDEQILDELRQYCKQIRCFSPALAEIMANRRRVHANARWR